MENQKNVKVKIEKISHELEETADKLEDVEDNYGYMIRAHNDKMTEVDQLKEKMRTMQARINELEKPWVHYTNNQDCTAYMIAVIDQIICTIKKIWNGIR